MKFYTFLLVSLVSLFGYSQTIYLSPVTENLTNQQVEQIARTIKISDTHVIIETVIDSNSTDIQQMQIIEVVRNFDTNGENFRYSLKSLDGVYPSLLIVYMGEKINEIHMIQPNQSRDGNERYRFLID